MAPPHHIYFTQHDAYQVIVEETLASPGRETGGILIGRSFPTPDGPILLVVAASGPGQHAKRAHDAFAPDIEALQFELQAWRMQFAFYQIDYVGQWHTHPPGYTALSLGDLYQVQAMLADPSYYLPQGIFVPLVLPHPNSVELLPYYVPRKQPQPQIVPFSILEGDGGAALAVFAAKED